MGYCYSKEKVREELSKLADKKYQQFYLKLCPGQNNILGVRIPILRNYAKKMNQEQKKQYIESTKVDYYEEIMLQGLLIGQLTGTIEEIEHYITKFIPKIDNWSICDTFCSGLKITQNNKRYMWKYIQNYLNSNQEFEVRFAVVILLNYFITEEYIQRILQVLDKVQHQGYYVKMAVAWAISMCFIRFPQETMIYLKENSHLDKFTYQKALQKIIESYQVDEKTKEIIRQMKGKNYGNCSSN